MPESNILENRKNSCPPDEPEAVFSSNCVRLSGYEWIFVGIVALALFCFGPTLWERIEKFKPETDCRMPYELSNDYWLYSRYCRLACSRQEVLVIGDSVIWGHFVSKHNTLSDHLNKITGRDQFANLGVDGIHPVALAGLLKYYGHDISNKKVVLHFNPLWMSSKKHDLQTEKEFRFNHPRLVPQFIPNIPCYKDPYSQRFSAVVERYVPFLSWTSHLKITYFENMDLPTWTLEHPHENPASAVTLELPTSANNSQNEHISWTEKGTAKTDFQWVELETSLQWNFFQRSVKLLKKRGNSVFVLVGPFNEHMLKGESIEIYRKMKSKIEDWLQQNNIAYYMPATLPSEWYVDASHPMSEGYAMLAKQLFENESFRASILTPSPKP
ncbi:MAG TPA: hypothetical protein VMW72_22060 [Sedimentisphaerales bacterium]|nr:hypothetical protein [Sedimentisphaerales bacterium]